MKSTGQNICSFYLNKNNLAAYDFCVNYASGNWQPDIGEPDFNRIQAYQRAKVGWLFYGAGRQNRSFTYKEATTHRFTIKSFLRLCRILKATPVFGLTVSPDNQYNTVLAAVEARDIAREITANWPGEYYLQVGIEPMGGKWNGGIDTSKNWANDITPDYYAETYYAIHSVTQGLGAKYLVATDPPEDNHPNPHQNAWNDIVQPLIAGLYDAVSTTEHIDEVATLIGKIDKMYEYWQVPVFLNEWSYYCGPDPDIPGRLLNWDTVKHYTFILNALAALEEHPYLLAATSWIDGGPFKFFEKGTNEPFVVWGAFELFASEPGKG